MLALSKTAKHSFIVVCFYIFAIIVLCLSEYSWKFRLTEIQWSIFGLGVFAVGFLLTKKCPFPRWLLIPPIVMIVWPLLVDSGAMLLMLNGYSHQLK